MQRRLLVLSAMVALLAVGLAACGTTASLTGGAQTVTVALKDFKIQTSQATFTSGTRYHFVVKNMGGTEHEFLILPPVKGNMDNMGDMHSMHMGALAVVEHIAPGATKTVDVTFERAAAVGTLELACHIAGHYEAGMRAPISVL